MNNLSAVKDHSVQQFIFEQEHADEQHLILKGNPIFGVDAKTIANQIAGRRKVRVKLPLWYSCRGIVYPPALHLEQSSSQATGLFKQKIVNTILPDRKNLIGADLTCGFGIDSFFLSAGFKNLFCVDQDRSLLAITESNHQVLGLMNCEYLPVNAETFIQSNTTDFIFVDPSRRNQSQKVFKLSDCSPDVVSLQEKFLTVAKHVLIKCSPMLDIQQGLKELNSVKRIWVVAVANECKEILFWMESGWSRTPTITAVDLMNDGSLKSELEFTIEEEQQTSPEFSLPKLYLYEPNAAIMKAGAFKLVAAKYGMTKLDRHTHLYTSQQPVDNFPGRVFKIEVTKATGDQLKTLEQANIITRNYPLSPEELKKKYKLQDGGDHYVIGYTCENERYLTIANRIQ